MDKQKITIKLVSNGPNANGDCFYGPYFFKDMNGKEVPFVSDKEPRKIIGKAKLFVEGNDLYAEVSSLDNDHLPELVAFLKEDGPFSKEVVAFPEEVLAFSKEDVAFLKEVVAFPEKL